MGCSVPSFSSPVLVEERNKEEASTCMLFCLLGVIALGFDIFHIHIHTHAYSHIS